MTNSGQKFDYDKPMCYLLDPLFIEGMAKILTAGARKYAPNDWQKVPNAQERYLSALYRHLLAYHRGELNDPESGLSHLYHIGTCAMILDWFDRNSETDVRNKNQSQK